MDRFECMERLECLVEEAWLAWLLDRFRTTWSSWMEVGEEEDSQARPLESRDLAESLFGAGSGPRAMTKHVSSPESPSSKQSSSIFSAA